MLSMSRRGLVAIIMVGALVGLGIFLLFNMRPSLKRTVRLREWLRTSSAHAEWAVHAGTRCGNAPFLFPTDGLIGFLWDDSFRVGHRHSGLDIFGGTAVGMTPVVAAFPGYLTRLPGWRSAVIVRLPEDPLQPGRQIWLYYTHMADPNGNSFISSEFPPGTTERSILAGTLLGYQGNYTGDAANPSGVHLHFSIVLDDGNGNFRNELEIENTLDPSPYLGIPLNGRTAPDEIVVCEAEGN
jgi:hypothetical protein